MRNITETKKTTGCWFLTSRMGLLSLAIGGTGADMVNMFNPAAREALWLGPLTNLVGDTPHGFNAMSLGFILWGILEGAGVERSTARKVSLAMIGLAWLFVVTAEMTGFMNRRSDILDLPAAAIGLLGSASMWELNSNKARTALT